MSGPETWWHEAVGGKIAEERPPPPGDKDPFPNLATIPPKPAPPDAAAWNRMTAELLVDRIAARQAAALAPIPVPSAPAPAARLFGTPAAPPAEGTRNPAAQPPASGGREPQGQEPAASAALDATTRPPSAPGRGPREPTAMAAPAGTGGASLPPLPAAPPPRPNFAPGPPPPAVLLTAVPPLEPSRPSGGTDVDFSANAASLDDAALDAVKALARSRGDHGIAVTGHGDAAASGALAQSDAVDLALRRAEALATALAAQGVPAGAVRVHAEAAGRGANLRLLE